MLVLLVSPMCLCTKLWIVCLVCWLVGFWTTILLFIWGMVVLLVDLGVLHLVGWLFWVVWVVVYLARGCCFILLCLLVCVLNIWLWLDLLVGNVDCFGGCWFVLLHEYYVFCLIIWFLDDFRVVSLLFVFGLYCYTAVFRFAVVLSWLLGLFSFGWFWCLVVLLRVCWLYR